MKTLWNFSNYGNDLRLTRSDAQQCTHPGPCDADVDQIMAKPYIQKQLKEFDPAQLRKELNDYGCWSDEDLANHEDNLQRWVWISARDIVERGFKNG